MGGGIPVRPTTGVSRLLGREGGGKLMAFFVPLRMKGGSIVRVNFIRTSFFGAAGRLPRLGFTSPAPQH